MHLKIKKGLDIPLGNLPEGEVHNLPHPKQVGLTFAQFKKRFIRLLVKPGDAVKVGQPIAEDKDCPGRYFVSPASGTLKEVRRGLKRSLQTMVIDCDATEQYFEHPKFDLKGSSREELVAFLMKTGGFSHIKERPFDCLADPHHLPNRIFVKAIESAPGAVPPSLQVKDHEFEFQKGLDVLAKLTNGKVHLVCHPDAKLNAFRKAQGVEMHTAKGPHPSSNSSVHIHHIAPIKSVEDIVWTLSALDVVVLGHLVTHGRYFTERIVSICGPGFLKDRVGYFRTRLGVAVADLIQNRLDASAHRLISGDVLSGDEVSGEDFLGFSHTILSAIEENHKREFLHFFRLGAHKFTASGTYLSGFLKGRKEYSFTSNQHGEERAFIDGRVYDEVLPMNLSTQHLVKAVICQDYDRAEEMGLLEVAAEDFSLPAFVCPSKIEMPSIVEKGLSEYAEQVKG